MANYRIIKKTFLDGNIYYRVQERILYFFWYNTERSYYFNVYLSAINFYRQNEKSLANLVGRRHSRYKDALNEIDYHKSCERSREVVKNEIIEYY